EPLFDIRRLSTNSESAPAPAFASADLSQFFRVVGVPVAAADLMQKIKEHPEIEAAYLKPRIEMPFLNDLPPKADEPPTKTPDFSGDQGYLSPGPVGIDAQFAWQFRGGAAPA